MILAIILTIFLATYIAGWCIMFGLAAVDDILTNGHDQAKLNPWHWLIKAFWSWIGVGVVLGYFIHNPFNKPSNKP